jgi:hypothetical protein
VRLNFSYCAETSGHGRKCSLTRSPGRNRAADLDFLAGLQTQKARRFRFTQF